MAHILPETARILSTLSGQSPGASPYSSPSSRSSASRTARPVSAMSAIADTPESGNTPTAAEPETIDLHVPSGETGSAIARDATPSQSMVNLYTFEQIHAAAHRALAEKHGHTVERQRIRLSTGISPDGDMVAVAGVTETVVSSPSAVESPAAGSSALAGEEVDNLGAESPVPLTSNNTTTIRELAYLSAQNRLWAVAGSAIFGPSLGTTPLIRHAGTAAGALRTAQNAAALRAKTDTPDLLEVLSGLSTRELQGVAKALEPVRKAVEGLQATLDNLSGDGAALTALAVSGGEPVAQAKIISAQARPGTHALSVEQTASPQRVRGSVFQPASKALKDLTDNDGNALFSESSYTFSLNGTSVTLSTDETLQQVARKINLGEDLNGNGVLNVATPDYRHNAYSAPASLFATLEEDGNGNGTLDGGTSKHGIRAGFSEGKFLLEQNSPGASPIQIDDRQGFFTALGLTKTAGDGRIVFADELSPLQPARYAVNDMAASSPSNTVTDAVEGLELLLKQAGDSEIRVVPDAEGFSKQLEQLSEAYNRAVVSMNEQLSPHLAGLLKEQEHVNRIYRQFRDAITQPVDGQPKELDTADDAGLRLNPGTPATFHALQLQTALERLNANSNLSPLQKMTRPETVYNSLDTAGIRTKEDNTLSVDEERVTRAVNGSADALRDLFRNDESGLLSRLVETVSRAADPERGTLAFAERQAFGMLGSNAAQSYARSVSQIQNAYRQSQLLGQLASVSIVA